jgi:hypothetical protein
LKIKASLNKLIPFMVSDLLATNGINVLPFVLRFEGLNQDFFKINRSPLCPLGAESIVDEAQSVKTRYNRTIY